MTYRVYQSDIDGGLRSEPFDCPVARAIRRRHPTTRIHVGILYVDINETEYRLPERVRDWIMSYDRGDDVKPFRFELLSTTV